MQPYSTDTITVSQYGSASMAATTAGTTVLVPSTATGRIHITEIILSNGATVGGWAYFGYGVGAVAPTTSAILINGIYSLANFTYTIPLPTPIVIPAQNNFLISTVTYTTLSCTVVYYIAP